MVGAQRWPRATEERKHLDRAFPSGQTCIHAPQISEKQTGRSLSKENISKVILKAQYVKNQLRKKHLKETTEHNSLFTFVSAFSLSIDIIIFKEFCVKQIGAGTSGIWIIDINVTPYVPRDCKAWGNLRGVCVCVFLQNLSYTVSIAGSHSVSCPLPCHAHSTYNII